MLFVHNFKSNNQSLRKCVLPSPQPQTEEMNFSFSFCELN